VNRGGSWNNNARNCRSANRNNNSPGNRNNNLGLRLAARRAFGRKTGSLSTAGRRRLRPGTVPAWQGWKALLTNSTDAAAAGRPLTRLDSGGGVQRTVAGDGGEKGFYHEHEGHEGRAR
jgi:hypothetical protein